MSQLYLPAEHTEADLVLAGTIAERLGSAELYVVWAEGHGGAVPVIPALLREPTPHWTDALAFAFQAGCNYGFMAWSVEHFLRTHHWQPGQTTRALGFLIVTCGSAGLYVGGLLCDRWQKRGIIDAPLLVSIPSGIGILLFLPAAMLAGTPELALALAAPGLFCLALPMGAAGASLQHIVPNQLRGQVSALYLFILNIGGLPIGSYVPGYLTTIVFKNDQMLGVSVALTIAVCATLMLVLITTTRRPYRRHYEMMRAQA